MLFFATVVVRLGRHSILVVVFFFFNDTATTEIYTLSLHDALPISHDPRSVAMDDHFNEVFGSTPRIDRKSTRLNSSHLYISYAVFCLKKKTPHAGHVHTLLFPHRHTFTNHYNRAH